MSETKQEMLGVTAPTVEEAASKPSMPAMPMSDEEMMRQKMLQPVLPPAPSEPCPPCMAMGSGMHIGQPMGMGRVIYGVFHMILTLVAIYLSFVCNKGFSWLGFAAALLFPHLYIIYTLATKGTCGLLEKKI